MSAGNLFILGSKVKVTRHKNKSVTVFSRNDISTRAAYVSYAGFSQRPMLLPTAGFSVRVVLVSGKNISGVGHDTLVSAGFF